MNKTVNDTELNINNKENNIKLVCDRKEHIKKQQKVIAAFFKEFFTWSAANIGMWILSGIMVVNQAVFFTVQYQEVGSELKEDRFIVIMIAFMSASAAMSYIQPYMNYNENRVATKIFDKIRYLPVSRDALRLFRFKKLFKFVGLVFAVDFTLQIIMTLLIVGNISIGNILYPLVIGFIVPFVLTGVYILSEDILR